jgi:hypothetical protein
MRPRRPVDRVRQPAEVIVATPLGRAQIVRAKPPDSLKGDTHQIVWQCSVHIGTRPPLVVAAARESPICRPKEEGRGASANARMAE